MALVLRYGRGNKNACKTLIAAEYCGVKVECEKKFKNSGETNLFAKYFIFGDRNVNADGEVPLLETPEGVIVESNVMARYVAMMGDDWTLLGSSFFDRVQMEQWIEYSTTEIDSVLTRWVWTRTGVYDYDG